MRKQGYLAPPRPGRGERTIAFGTVHAAIAAGYSAQAVFEHCARSGFEIIQNGPFRGRMYARNELGQRQRVVLTMSKTRPEASSPVQEPSDATEHTE